jgi:hypothetical protein
MGKGKADEREKDKSIQGEERYTSTHSYPWYYMKVSDKFHALAVLHPGKKPSTH